MDKHEAMAYILKVREIRTSMEVGETIRECCECGDKMLWSIFMLPGSHKDRKGNLEKFGFDLLLEIWLNPIFVIKCCWCYAGVDNPNIVIDHERQANWRSL